MLGQPYVDAIKQFEGFTPQAKWDYKQFSNGYGTRAKYPGENVDEDTANQRLNDSLSSAYAAVDPLHPDMPEGVKAALTSLTHNVGTGWINAGLGARVKAGDWDGAKNSLLAYNRAGGEINDGLVKRRASEAQWFGGETPTANSRGNTKMADAATLPPYTTMLPGQSGASSGDWGDALQHIGVASMALSNPAAANALVGAMKAQDGKYSFHFDPTTGQMFRINSKSGQIDRGQGAATPKSNIAYDEAMGKHWADLNTNIAKSSMDAGQHLGTLDQLEKIYGNPSVYQGKGGEWINEVKRLGIAFGMKDQANSVKDADTARALANQITLGMRNQAGGMPGSLSDKDLLFLKGMSTSLENQPEANLQIIKNLKAVQNRHQDVEKMRQRYISQNGRIDDGFTGLVNNYAMQNPLFADSQSAAPAATVAPSGNRPPLSAFMK